MKMSKLAALVCALSMASTAAAAEPFNDIHFHPTNYIQQGITLQSFIDDIMGDVVQRSIIAPLPLQQKWDAFVSGDRAPDYYLRSDAALYYYSFADAVVAAEYLQLSKEDQARLDPMIVGFNPTDMYAADHIRRVVQTYPGVFTGIGEFSIHKEAVSPKVSGHTASLLNPALDGIFKATAEIGLVSLVHCDVNTIFAPNGPEAASTAHFDDLMTLFKRHPNTAIIWAHTGLGRFVKPSDDHLKLLGQLLTDPELNHVLLDISWDLLSNYLNADVEGWASIIKAHPTRFIFGTDSVGPKSQESYVANYEAFAPVWKALPRKVLRQVAQDNYVRVMDAARERVRAWEAAQQGFVAE